MYLVEQLHTGVLIGYSTSGNDLIIANIKMNDDRNNAVYSCVTSSSPSQPSNTNILYVAGECQYNIVMMLNIIVVSYTALSH